MSKSEFVPIPIAARMWDQPYHRVKQWAERSRKGTMQKHPLPKEDIRLNGLTGRLEVTLSAMQTKVGEPKWSLEEIMLGKDLR